MKRKIAFLFVAAMCGLGIYCAVKWQPALGAEPGGTAEPKNKEKTEEPAVSRDTNGHTVITLEAGAAERLGITAQKPAREQLSPELQGFGRVIDPAALIGAVTELASAEAAYVASSNEVSRLTTLQGQGNASAKALQAAQATALHDRVGAESARNRLLLGWGNTIANRVETASFGNALISLEAVLVRVDLPAGESAPATPSGARLETLGGKFAEGSFLSAAPSIDSQFQGQAFFFMVSSNQARMKPGEALTAYVRFPGEPLSGVVVPGEAVVRTEGAGWVYVMNSASNAFTRIRIPLVYPTEKGWFVTNGIGPGDNVVVSAAQQLLSTELKGQGE